MASRSLPVPLQQVQKQSRARITVRAPSLRTAAIVFVAVLILFRWLHLILALQIAYTGRQIQTQNQELQQLERENSVLQAQIAAAESPELQAQRAEQLGYAAHSPVYLQIDQPAGQAPSSKEIGENPPAQGPASSASPHAVPSGFDSAFSTWLEATPVP